MALTLDMKYMVRSLASGGAYNYAASTGLPSILVERGCMGLCPRFDVEAYKKDLLRLMHGLGMTENEPEPQQFVPKDMRNMKYLEAPRSGCWLEEAECGAVIKKGEPLGRLRGLFGEDETVFSAEYTGVLLYSCSAFAAPEGVVLAAYGVPDAE